MDALIRYYARVDPTQLSDTEWAILAEDIKWVRDEERKTSERHFGKLSG
jgi:hypothetical protein